MTDPESHLSGPEPESAVTPGPLMETVRASVEGFGWTYRALSATAISFPLREAKSVYEVLLLVDEERMSVGCYCSHPARVPAARRGAVAEAIVRINWSLSLGGFDLDFSDGEIRYRVALDVEGGALTERMVDNLIGCAVHTSERYHDALLRVAFGDGDPEVETAGLELPD